MSHTRDQGFPVSAGILFGLGLGGFFDGIGSASGAPMAPHADQRRIPFRQRGKPEGEHLLGRSLSRGYLHFHGPRPLHSVAVFTEEPRALVEASCCLAACWWGSACSILSRESWTTNCSAFTTSMR